ncbi:MAG: YfcE family phosphodiesterase [Candidatus Heimdallarchaeota archaeon]|nr:YfcE family phosphodiesterase [Candidatus Heimdallarchaeota archaeon]
MPVNMFIAGDLHIPSRATMLHPFFQEILQSKKWDFIILTGDLTTREVLKKFENYVKIPERIIACKGNMDQFNLALSPTFNIGSIKFGVFHGTGISPRGDVHQLKKIANKLDVKILITGHSHQMLVYSDKQHLILNPGTATGATGGSSWYVDKAILILIYEPESEKIIIESYKIDDRNSLKKSKEVIDL